MKNNTNYFSHDCNARNDERIMMLRSDHGWKGYGIYFAIIEILSEATGYKLEMKSIEVISKLYDIDKLVISYLFELKLLVDDGVLFRSPNLIKRMAIKDDKKKKQSEGGVEAMRKRRGEEESDKLLITSKVKERKEEKKKEIEKFSDQQEKIEQDRKRREVNTRGKTRIKIWNEVTGRNDLMEDATFRGLQNFISDMDNEGFQKRVELFKNCTDKINEYKLAKYLDTFGKNNIHEYSITDFIKKINLFGKDEQEVFSNITGKDYITKVLRIISEKKEEPRKEYSTPKPTGNPEELRKAQEEFRKKFGK